ncbi:MAG: hypothetical protein M3291_00595 [Actinomycetota bacterium]|nr:hypothetical protein [Actinomycetota bacterium]
MARAAHRWGFVITMTAVLFALVGPGTAAAHIAGGASPTNSRSAVTEISPAGSGVGVTVGLGGQFVRVSDRGAEEIVIVGYRGEPFLRLSQQGVQVNPRSTTAEQTGQLPPTSQSADTGSADTGEQWVTLSDGDSVSWTDARADGRSLPEGASESWTLPLVVDGRPVTILGMRTGLAAPSPWPWVAALGLVALAVAALGGIRDWHRPVSAVIVAGVAAFGVHMLGSGAAPQPGGPFSGWVVIAVLGAFCLLVAGVTVVGTLRGTELAASRLPMMAVTLLLLAGTDISGLWNSQLPFAGPAVLDRGLLVVIYGVALGLLVAGVRLARAPSPAR